MTVATISTKGWVVIPAELRRKYALKPGTRVVLVDYGGLLTIVPAKANPIEESMGMFKDGESLTQALLTERAQERARED